MPIIESNTTALIGLALDGTTMRQQAFAHNIANANTPNFVPVTVNFEGRMAEARAVVDGGKNLSLASLSDYRPTFESAPESIEAGPISLDVQVARMSENVLHHQTLLKALNKHFEILGMAINEGKR
jgi:flagellar basal-body rod protein FlgB